MKRITLKHLDSGEEITIECKDYNPTKNGFIYIQSYNEYHYEFLDYKLTTDLVFWNVEEF